VVSVETVVTGASVVAGAGIVARSVLGVVAAETGGELALADS